MEEARLLGDVAVALALALAGGLVAHRFGLSPIIGYLAAGLAVGPFTPGYQADPGTLHQLADVGVVFIMFGVGLHFNLADLVGVRRVALPAGVAQVVLVAVIAWALGLAVGLPSREAVVFGMALSISSTVVLVRALEERDLATSIVGRTLIGWLIVQDLATIVLLVLLPILASTAESGTASALWTAARAVTFAAAALIAGPRVVPALLRLVGRTGSRELFVLVVVCLSLGIAVGAEVAGASLALGAFIAGVATSETEGSHQAASDILPLRDAFAVLFFVSIGMLIDPRSLIERPLVLAAAVAAILFVKPLVSGLLAGAFPVPGRTALVAAAGLGQAGEFSFILAEAGRTLGIVEPMTYHALLGASALSIAVNPLAFRAAAGAEELLRTRRRIWGWLDRRGPALTDPSPPGHHVIIAGAGRVGRLASRALEDLEIAHVFIEASLETVLGLQHQGRLAYWGDAASADVLQAAGISSARLLILAVPDAGSASLAAHRAHDINPGLAIVARAHSSRELATLRGAAANSVIVPEFEGALAIVRASLAHLEVDAVEIARVSETIHAEEYSREVDYEV